MLEDWWAAGSHEELAGRRIFVRVEGEEGPWTTWLHGFPTSSYDWGPLLRHERPPGRHLLLDFLGFGASDKPKTHSYSMVEQADIVEAAWAAHGITETRLISHDYGVSVAQELLARSNITITEAVFLNGGLFPDLHHPTRMQKLVAGPLGPLMARLANEKTYSRGLQEVMNKPPSAEELHQHWLATSRDGGKLVLPNLLGYIKERRANEERWVGALTGTPEVPKRFVWGPEDPVSGAHVLPEIRRRVPEADVHVIEGVGHWPQLEDVAAVAAALRLGPSG